jgi:adenylate cyclase
LSQELGIAPAEETQQLAAEINREPAVRSGADSRLVAILAADAAGYSRLMAGDDRATVAALDTARAVFRRHIEANQGRVIDMAGDSILAVFETATGAVVAALAIQEEIGASVEAVPEDRRLRFRIGVHLGDVIEKADGTVYGNGVNIAARLEGLAEPGGIILSDLVHGAVRDRIEATFEDAGEHNVKNIPRAVRAYRVLGEAAVPRRCASAAVAKPSVAGGEIDLSLPDKPSIAVLPFANLSGDPEQDYFADGLVEDIITTLSKISGLSVIARNSSFTYKGRAVDVRQVARELGVRYVLEGGVRKSANRIRITAQLIDAGTGAHVWAERYDRAIEDIFAVQDEITLVLATEMQVRLTEGEQARLRYATTHNIQAWNHWVQGLSHFRRGLSREGQTQALKSWQQANALDPSSACLNAMLGFLHYLNARFGFWDDRETALRKGGAYVDKALSLDPENSDAHMTRSLLLMLQRRFDEAVLAARKAIEYGPGSADNAVFASYVFDNAGLVQEAVVQIERAMKLSPIFPPNYLGQLGNAYRLAGRYDEAVAAYEAYHKRSPGHGITDLVIIYEQLGQPEKAKAWATQLLLAEPKFSVSSWADTQFRKDTARLEAEMAALRAAGLPD